jgi:hypothetical protein
VRPGRERGALGSSRSVKVTQERALGFLRPAHFAVPARGAAAGRFFRAAKSRAKIVQILPRML